MLCRIEPVRVRNIMAKKSKSPGKGESKAPVKEETIATGTDVYIPTPESGGIINFYYLFGGLGILMTIFMIIYLLLHFVFHIL
jgi:hypothetical protein